MTCTLQSGHQLYPRPGEMRSHFPLSPSNHLLVLDYYIFNREKDKRFFRFPLIGDPYRHYRVAHIIRLAPFLQVVEAFRGGQRVKELVPWEEWGPRNSRTIRSFATLSASGSCVFFHRNGRRSCTLWDLNALPFQKAASAVGGSWKQRVRSLFNRSRSRVVGVDQPSMIARGDHFAQDVLGTLPYFEVVSALPGNVMLYHEILGGSPPVVAIWRRPRNGGMVRSDLDSFRWLNYIHNQVSKELYYVNMWQ